jgi:hypothetical protein
VLNACVSLLPLPETSISQPLNLMMLNQALLLLLLLQGTSDYMSPEVVMAQRPDGTGVGLG